MGSRRPGRACCETVKKVTAIPLQCCGAAGTWTEMVTTWGLNSCLRTSEDRHVIFGREHEQTMKCVIGMDFGTLSARAILVDAAGGSSARVRSCGSSASWRDFPSTSSATTACSSTYMAALLAVLVLLTLFFSVHFIAAHADHDCIGVSCSTYEWLTVCMRTFRTLCPTLCAAVVVFASAAALQRLCGRRGISRILYTPVLLMFKLSN